MSSILNDDTRYVKLVLLLVKGGTYFCKKHTLQILDNDYTTIDKCLEMCRDQIYNAFKKNVISKKLWELLCPDSRQPKDVDVWDISAYVYFLLNLFYTRLTSLEKVVVTSLRDMRNDLAHSGGSSLPEAIFLGKWSQLAMILFQLSIGLTDNDQNYVNRLINEISAIQDLIKASDELKPFENSDDFVKDVLAEQHRSYERRLDECCRRICELEEFKRNIESGHLDIKARITVSASTQTACDAAHHQLIEAAKQCLTCGHAKQDNDEVFTACNNVFTDMSEEGASLKQVEQGSVLLVFSCSTWTSLKNAFFYLTKTLYIQRLQELEKALSQSVGCWVKLNVNIVLESLTSALDKAEHCTSNKSVILTMSCTGSKGVHSVCDNLVNGSSTNTINNLSEALSRSVGQRIELHTNIDVDKLEENILQLECLYGKHGVHRSLSYSDKTIRAVHNDQKPAHKK